MPVPAQAQDYTKYQNIQNQPHTAAVITPEAAPFAATNLVNVDGLIDSVGDAAKDLYKGIKPKADAIAEKAEPKVQEAVKAADTKTAEVITTTKDKVIEVSGSVKAKADEVLGATS